jgi:hypothetical protein
VNRFKAELGVPALADSPGRFPTAGNGACQTTNAVMMNFVLATFVKTHVQV